MKFISAFIVAAVTSCSPAFAAGSCDAPWSEVAAVAHKEGAHVIELTAQQRGAVVANYDKMRGADVHPDHAYVIDLEGAPKVIIVLVNRGCVLTGGTVAREHLPMWLGGEAS